VSGYREVMAKRVGSINAQQRLEKAAQQIKTWLGPNARGAEVDRFLASPYGGKVAEAELNGSSLADQLEYRSARFMRHYREVQRNV